MNYWLMKSEGNCYSIDDLKKDKQTSWSGVRNYQARNFMRDSMSIGDLVLFYHSNGKPSGIFGIAKIVSKPHSDKTQFNKNDNHYDSTSKQSDPRWICVDVGYVKKLIEPVSLQELKDDPVTASMMVCRQGSRLSIQPVSERHFKYITESKI